MGGADERSDDTDLGTSDQALSSACLRFFGSHDAAFEAAGLESPSRRWTKQSVIAEIWAWHDSGHRLAEVSTKYQALFNAAKTHFGGWNNAIIAAGIRKTATWRC